MRHLRRAKAFAALRLYITLIRCNVISSPRVTQQFPEYLNCCYAAEQKDANKWNERVGSFIKANVKSRGNRTDEGKQDCTPRIYFPRAG